MVATALLCASTVRAQVVTPPPIPGGTAPVTAVAPPQAQVEAVSAPASEEETTAVVEDAVVIAPPPTVEPPPPPSQPPAPPVPSVPSASGGSSAAPSGVNGLPFELSIHGYYRARLMTLQDIPTTSTTGSRPETNADASFGFHRLRIEPTLTWGNAQKPAAALKMQIDALDNVVFGDNERVVSTPLFAEKPTTTDIAGLVKPDFFLRRAWLEFLMPIGQIRIGRQPSHGGMGLLFNDGNGFKNDFGDSLGGTSFDRILFATRPLTIYNTLARGDSRDTPLVFALGYDWLVEDTLGFGGARTPTRSNVPFSFLTEGGDDVYQIITALIWNDPDFNKEVNAKDELNVGTILVYRGQDYQSSNIFIGDWFWKLKYTAFGRKNPWFYTEGEVYTIQGATNGLTLAPDFCSNVNGCADPNGGLPTAYGRSRTRLNANVWGLAARAGAETDTWTAYAEYGYQSGQHASATNPVGGLANPAGNELRQRANNADYQVGLLLYPVAVATRTALAYGDAFSTLWSKGGVWNSHYFLPRVQYRPLSGLELYGQFIVAFADQLNQAIQPIGADGNPTPAEACGIQGKCLLGWEADVAAKIHWGPNDEMRWSTEFGIAGVGDALGPYVTSPIMWTLQSRVALVY